MVLTEVWVELKTDDGRVYFWNRRDNSRAWTLPEGQEVKWIGEKSQDGRTYYWSRLSKETVWVLPPLEPEKSEKKEEPEPSQQKGALASLLRGEKPKEDEKGVATEDVKQQQQALTDALLQALPVDDKPQGPEGTTETAPASASPPVPEAKEPEQSAEQAQAQPATAEAATAAAGFPGVNPMGLMDPMSMGTMGPSMGAMDPMQAMMMAQMGMAPSLPGLMMPGLGGLPGLPGMMPSMPGVMPCMPGLPGGLPGSMPGSMPMPAATMPGMGMTGGTGMPGVAQSQPATAPAATMPPAAPTVPEVAPAAPTAPMAPTAPGGLPATAPAAPAVPPAAATDPMGAAQPSAPAPTEPVEETYEEHPYLEEEQEPTYCPPPDGLPGPKGDSASAIAARHVIEAAGVDTWFLKLPGGEWEEVVRFWPPPEDLDVARPPKLKKKPRMDKWKTRSLAMRCQRHEEVVRALLVAQYSTARSFTVEKYPCPLSTEWCFWGSDGRQITCEEPEAKDGLKIPSNFERNPPEGQRCKLMQNKTRSQLSMVFKATKLRHLERALGAAQHRRSQQLLQEVGASVPQVLKAAAKRLGVSAEEPMVKAMPRPPKAAPPQEAPADPPAAVPAGVASPVSPPKAEEPVSSEAAPWKKRRVRGERSAAAAPAPAERPVAAGFVAPAPAAAPVVEMAEESKNVKELLPRKVLLSNVPQNATVKELSDFFTGAIFTATGHTLTENVKVVELVELQGGHAEVLFATALSATIAVALHGMNFQNKLLGIRRPPGFSGPTLNRTKLLTVAMKDLVSEDLPDLPEAAPAAAAPAPAAPGAASAVVKITGIPASMNGTSIFDCLQQFGGPLKSLSLTTNRETGEHNGSGTAEFVEHASAVEACRFSPFFGFIEVTMQEPPAAKTEIEAPGPGRRSRWSQQDDIDDLGPFNEVLPPKPSLSLARATSKARPAAQAAPPAPLAPAPAADDLDLGPFADLLPPAPAQVAGVDDDLDLGPFNDILRKVANENAEDDLDLGPFAAILPPRS